MADTFTDASRALFAKNVFAHVATLESDGSPNVTPVWCLLDGDEIVINTALGRAKAKNLANDERVALSLTDPDNPYTVIAVRGTVVAFTTEGADEVIDQLAKKYMGVDSYPLRREGEVRVTVRIRPDRIAQQPA
ncbi:MAG TPA: PPOX class F420-dependent oxidoreductase [Acidimicrobiales bacterium]|jgi:PPOX class probable F420-dependent enzyme